MKLQVFHRTHYAYAAPVRDSFNEARLQPWSTEAQNRHNFILKVLPSGRLTHYLDFYLNTVHVFEINMPHSELVIEATSVVTTQPRSFVAEDLRPAPLSTMEDCQRLEFCYDFQQPSTYVDITPEVWKLALDITAGETDAWQASLAIMRFIHREFRYQPATTHAHTTMGEALQLRTGVCQDFTHVMLGLCRALKIPARYVSGYLYNGPADQLKGAQASHAWAEVYIPSQGWIGLDPTNNRHVGEHHIKIAIGRDYGDVQPVKGTYRGTQERKLSVEVLVTRLEEDQQQQSQQQSQSFFAPLIAAS